MSNTYNLILKTGEAELRAFRNTVFQYDKLFPLIEFTRGRKSSKNPNRNINNVIKKTIDIFSNCTVGVDLTSDPTLSCDQIEYLYDPTDGYDNWIKFVTTELKPNFRKIIPTLLLNTDDEYFNDNLKKQAISLCKDFQEIIYRNNIEDEGFIDDLITLSEVAEKYNRNIILIIDCEYIGEPYILESIVTVCNERISEVIKINCNIRIIVAATSFPNNISKIGNDKSDKFRLVEKELFNKIKQEYTTIEYGDYATVNPIRNDDVVMARGWIPRIDLSTRDYIYYIRDRKKFHNNNYKATYEFVAQKIIESNEFKSFTEENGMDNWGIKQILAAGKSEAPGSSAGFWISVRISTHLGVKLHEIG